MSKLTNCQIEAVISKLESSLDRALARGLIGRARETLVRKLALYRAELWQREEAGLNPGTEIQDSLAGRKP